jgi:hypothetical protein
MRDLTVIYYTCNRENPDFEARIRRNLWYTIKRKHLRLISVSHKPIDFGENICVGDVGVSSQNAWRQLQLGAIQARTRFICPTEADYIYPSEYFDFLPERTDTFYVASPLWVLFAQSRRGHVFCQKPRGSEAAMVVGRDKVIKRIEDILTGRGMWGTLDADGVRLPYLLNHRVVRREFFELPSPCVTFKTDIQMHRKTPHDQTTRTRFLPGIGTADDLIRKYL